MSQFISQSSGHTDYILIIKNAQVTLDYPEGILWIFWFHYAVRDKEALVQFAFRMIVQGKW